jgi:glucokinase
VAEKLAVGVDLGGTKIMAGVVNLSTGQLIASAKKKTRVVADGQDLVKRIASVIDEAISDAGVDVKKLSGIGIGAAGMVDRERGVLLAAANIGANDVAMAEPLQQQFGLKVKLGNDVEVATIGELAFGAGRECDNFVCIFVGTGIGSGIVHKGEILRGASGTAGEIGHIIVVPDGRDCGCGGFGCLETYASRTAVARNCIFDINIGFDSILRDKIDPAKGGLRSKAISQAYELGDSVAVRAVDQAARIMGIGLASVVNFYNPQRIILGGGFIEAMPLYFEKAEAEMLRRSLRIPRFQTELVRAELGDYAGTIGAALLTK